MTPGSSSQGFVLVRQLSGSVYYSEHLFETHVKVGTHIYINFLSLQYLFWRAACEVPPHRGPRRLNAHPHPQYLYP